MTNLKFNTQINYNFLFIIKIILEINNFWFIN